MRRIGTALAALVVVASVWGGTEPSPVAAVERPSVAVVGDSIGRDARPEITAEITRTNPVAYYHAIGAGYVDYHLPLLLPKLVAPGGPDIVVAELGTGDAFWSHSPRRFGADVRQFLNAVLPHVECVVWVDQKQSRNRAYPMINERAAAYNTTLHRIAAKYDDVHVVHYQAWTELAGSPSPYFLADWLHLTQAGERELGRLIGTAVRGCDPELTSGPFWDVQDSFWAADAIAWAAAEGIVTGYPNGTYRAVVGQFRPKVDRGQAAQMLWRLAGSPPAAAPHRWTDGRPALRAALRWGRAARVLSGYPDGTFRPRTAVQRGQLVIWLWRFADRPGGYPDHPWTDATPGLRPALNWAAAEGIVGTPAGAFRRTGTVDRAEIAVWLQRTDAFLHVPAPAPSPAPTTTTVPPTTAPPTTLPSSSTVSPPTTLP